MTRIDEYSPSSISRRSLIAGVGASLPSIRAARAQTPVTLTMTVWAAQAEEEAFQAVIARYKALHPEVTIRMDVNGNAMQAYQQVDTRLAGQAGSRSLPRASTSQVGRYASASRAIARSRATTSTRPTRRDFGPAFWQAASYKGKQYAHYLTIRTRSRCYYNKRDAGQKTGLDRAGQPRPGLDLGRVHPRGRRPEADKVAAPYGFAMSLAKRRRLPLRCRFVYQHGGAASEHRPYPVPGAPTPWASRRLPGRNPGSRKGWSPPSTSIKSQRAAAEPVRQRHHRLVDRRVTGKSRSSPRT